MKFKLPRRRRTRITLDLISINCETNGARFAVIMNSKLNELHGGWRSCAHRTVMMFWDLTSPFIKNSLTRMTRSTVRGQQA